MRDTAAKRMGVNRKVTEHRVGASSRMSRNRHDNNCSECGMGAGQPSVGQVLGKRRPPRMTKSGKRVRGPRRGWLRGRGVKLVLDI